MHVQISSDLHVLKSGPFHCPITSTFQQTFTLAAVCPSEFRIRISEFSGRCAQFLSWISHPMATLNAGTLLGTVPSLHRQDCDFVPRVHRYRWPSTQSTCHALHHGIQSLISISYLHDMLDVVPAPSWPGLPSLRVYTQKAL